MTEVGSGDFPNHSLFAVGVILRVLPIGQCPEGLLSSLNPIDVFL